MLTFLLLCQVAITFGVPLPENVVDSKLKRIATNHEDVVSGMSIDYRYNESRYNAAGGLSSAPGCPKSDLGYPWVYFTADTETTPKCYLAGQQGPCEYGQKIFVNRKDSHTGYCNCECFEGVKMDVNSAQFCSLPEKDVVFIPDVKKCYVLFEQGPCKENEWLVKRNELELVSTTQPFLVKCEERRCPERETPTITTSSEGSYNDTLKCNSSFNFPTGSVGPILKNDCPDNMRYSELLKQCVKTFEFTH